MTALAPQWQIIEGDALEVLATLPEASVQTCVTSPPYWGLRDYGVVGQIGLEPTPEEYVAKLVEVFRAVRRVLRDDGTVWLNLGDSYATNNPVGRRDAGGGAFGNVAIEGSFDVRCRQDNSGLKPKDLVGIPWRVAFALQSDGWYLRSEIIWAKPNPIPESVTDRPTKAHEQVFLLAKSGRYYYDAEAIREPDVGTDHPRNILHRHEPSGGLMTPHSGIRRADGRRGKGRNRRSVWTIPTQSFAAAHFAVFPPALVEPCILAAAPEGGTVLDPFAGSGTVGIVCRKHRRRFVGIELKPEYARMARGRLGEDVTEDAAAEGDAPLFDWGAPEASRPAPSPVSCRAKSKGS